MGRNEDFDNEFWDDPDVEPLTPPAKLLYIWSFTNPLCNMAGIYRTGPTGMAKATGLTAKQVERSVRELQEYAFWIYERPYLWVRSRVKRIGSKSPNMARSVARVIADLEAGHPIRRRFLDVYGEHEWLREALAELVRETRSTKPNLERVA